MSRAARSLAMQFISPLELCEVDSVDHSVFSSFVTGSLSLSLSTVFSNNSVQSFINPLSQRGWPAHSSELEYR